MLVRAQTNIGRHHPLYDIVEKPTIKGLVKARSCQYQEKAYLCP